MDALHGEDVVQDALRIVVEKAPSETPDLAWCFQVLRHTIGNHYRRERTRRRWVEQDPEGDKVARAEDTGMLEAMELREVTEVFSASIRELGGPEDRCRGYLGRMLEGSSPNDLASEEGIDPAVLYRRLYRCRQRLREILRKKGVRA